MLFTTRKGEDTLRLRDHIRGTVALMRGDPVRLGSEAPRGISVGRVATRSEGDRPAAPREGDAPAAR